MAGVEHLPRFALEGILINLKRGGLAILLATSLLAGTTPSFASSHREAPGITKLPKTDSTDFYMFRSYEPGRDQYVTLIANYIPLQDPGGGPNYFTMDPDAVYEIHIDNVGDAHEHITYQFKFNNSLQNNTGVTLNVGGKTTPIALRQVGPVSQAANDPNLGEIESYTVTMISGDRHTGTRQSITNAKDGSSTFTKPLDNTGVKTFPNYAAYANQFIYSVNIPNCAMPGKVFVGQRAEAFAVNLGSIFDLVDFVPVEGDSAPGAGDGKGFPGGITQSRANDELVGKKNVTSIAMEVPTACLTGGGNGVIGGWQTASLPQARLIDPNPSYSAPTSSGGAYTQVSRLGMPLVNELVIGLPDKDKFNSSDPVNDGQFLSYVTNPTFPAILDALFRGPVNATLGTSFASIAPTNFPRNDLVTTFLTGFPGVNQLKTVTPSEMQRLNTGIAPTPQTSQNTLGVAGDDLAGYPNGRRPGDDTVDITLRVAMGALCYPVPVNHKPTDLGLCKPSDAVTGNVPFTDGAPIHATDLQNQFPYLNPPLAGAPLTAHR
jgi:hypothetical protein